MNLKKLSYVANVIAAIILLQTLYFKFTGAEESVFIFTTVGMEPWGRYGSGAAELVAGILLLIPSLAYLGAGISLGIMLGAVLAHLTVLGIEVQGDGGYLFILALVVTLASALVVAVNFKDYQNLYKRLIG